LKAVLELRKHAPDGSEHGPGAFVFGNEVGEPIADIRQAWQQTCAAAGSTRLHFHDLRREFASRLRETPGISDHHVRDWLGHADMARPAGTWRRRASGCSTRGGRSNSTARVFAHDLHTQPQHASSEMQNPTPETPVNSLN
jgi:integrase